MIVIVDDEDRENEGDLMIAAEMITPEAINFMATRARGLICMAITGERADALELSPMVSTKYFVRRHRLYGVGRCEGKRCHNGNLGARPCPNGARDRRLGYKS